MAKAATHRTMIQPAASRITGSALGALCAVPLLLALGSCVAQETYDQAELSAKHWQDQAIRNEAEVSRLEEENRHLRGQLDAAQVQISEAGYTGDIDARLQDLRSIVAELGNEPGDVTKFSVTGGYVYRVKDSVLFDLGSSEIRPDGQRILQEVAADIRSRPHEIIYVRGHTDNLPVVRPETVARFPHGNLQLSAARAVEVAAFLTREGSVDSSDVVVMGFGPNEPVAPNDSDANRQKNRRVDIFVSDSTGGGE